MSTDVGQVEKNMDISPIVCTLRNEQERHQELGFCAAVFGGLLMFPIWSRLCFVCSADAADRFAPTSSLGGRVEGVGAVEWPHCLVQHIRPLDYPSLRFPFGTWV